MAETLTLQREYPYPADRLFRAWTDVSLLTQWFGCAENMLWTVHEWDVRPGGAIRVSLMFDHGPFEATGEFLVVEPPHRLRYRRLALRPGPARRAGAGRGAQGALSWPA